MSRATTRHRSRRLTSACALLAVLLWQTTLRAGVPACTPPDAPLPNPNPSSPSVQVCLGGDNALAFCELPADCPDGTCVAPTRVPNRYLNFQAPASWLGKQLALRLTLVTINEFGSFNGQTRWVGAPQSFPDEYFIHPDQTFQAAHVECGPVYREWASTELLHAYGTEIIPNSLYALQAIELGCDDANENDYSHPLLLLTHRWGDVTALFEDEDGPAGPQPDFTDTSYVAQKVAGLKSTQTKPRTQLWPNDPDPSRAVSVRDIKASVSAFVERSYAAVLSGPDSCPHRIPSCGDGVLDPGEECDDGSTAPGDGCDANCFGEGATAILRLLPINPPAETGVNYSPDVIISGNEFILGSGGHRLWFELQLEGWGGQLATWQATLPRPFSNDGGSELELATEECQQWDDCGPVFGTGSRCGLGTQPERCEAGFEDLRNPRFAGREDAAAVVAQHTLTFSCTPIFFGSPIADDGGTYYGGNLVLDVPSNAIGRYMIEFDPDPLATFLLDGSDPISLPIPIAALEPAVVRVVQGCCLGTSCTTVLAAECADLGGTPVTRCDGDCNGNSVADDCDLAAGASDDCNGNGVPDECDLTDATSADCNVNTVPDECDIAGGSSDDCNFDGIPDDCQPDEDCNTNAVRDICDIGAGTSEDCNFDLIPDECQPDEDCNNNSIKDICDIAEGTEPDCNGNLVPDACDIAGGGSLDDNGDGVPDECCVSQTPLFVGPVKSRFLSLESVGTLGVRSAIRVTPQSLPDFEAFEDTPLWVGPPREYPEENASQPGLTFTGAGLQCVPYYHDWSTIDLLHVFGGEIIPSAAYDVQLINEDCPNTLETNYSPALAATTGKWGDIEPPFQTPTGPPHPSFGDIAASVNKFLGAPGAPIKALAALVPNYVFPDRPIDFRGIAAVIEAFLGVPYSQTNGITGPCTCPGNVVCGARPCALDNQCVNNGYCLDGFCTDACGRCRP